MSSPYESPPSTDSDAQVRVLSGERRGVVYAFCWLFCILLGYFILRPVRETMGSLVGPEGLKQLFLAVFVVMLLLVPAYAALVARLPRRWIVRVVFHFFAVCLPAFWLLMRSGDETIQFWTARVLFVWISVFALFSTSVFWSVLADLFSSRQGRRLFGIIASGGTAGAIVGALLTSQLAKSLSTESLLLLPAVVIELGLWFAWRLDKQAPVIRLQDVGEVEQPSREGDQIASGSLLAGITHIFGSSYLASICLFLFFAQGFGTLLYIQQAEIVSLAIPDKQERTSLFAYLDLGTQVLTLFIQLALSGLILRRLGVSVALVLLPIVYLIGFSALAIDASLGTLIATVIASRGVAYGITVPTREVLFTVVSREDKYKSKNFIDTVVLRGGDTISSYIVGSLRSVGVAFAGLNVWALPLVVAWLGLSWQLGRRQRKLAMRELAVPIPRQGEWQEQNPGKGNH